MARRASDTGEPTPYTAKDEMDLTSWLDRLNPTDIGDGDELSVTADIEWAGTTNPNPHRTLRANGLDLTGVREALTQGTSGDRLGSYNAKSWQAMVNALGRTKAGQAALNQVLNVSTRTRRDWDAGKHTPSKANQDAISRAYEARATDVRAVAKAAERRAHRVADALSRSLKDRYGADVRLTNITDMDL